jgi:16S rRNA (cytosine967-C5)-methyltransferase
VATKTRVLAFAILEEVERGRTTVAEALATRDAETLDARDRALLHELVLGTLRRRGALDHALSKHLDRPIARVDPALLRALRLGAHQVLNLRVPDRAAVAESVDLARAANARGAGFVNAVLRGLARGGAPDTPDPTTDPKGWLTSAGSLPDWLAERWIANLGPAAAVARARAQLDAPPTSFRLNPRLPEAAARLEAAGIEATAGLVPGALRATTGRPAVLQAEGLLYLQDEGSQLVARLAAGPGRRLDACAAPGGKAFLMADVAGAAGTVVAAEASSRRLAAMRALALRWGAPNLRLLAGDGLRPPFRNAFAAVLLDAPCSGLGTIARNPDIRWRARASDVGRHAQKQSALLESVAALVEPGGLLVYSVCSGEPEETEGVLLPFLASHRAFTPEAPPSWAAAFASGPFLRTAPERDGGDGFFAGLLRRA